MSRVSRALGRALLAVCAATAARPDTARANDFPPAEPETWKLHDADLYAVDARGDLAWAVGYWGTMLRSQDGGRSFAPVATPTRDTLFGVSFADERNGWVVGAYGLILRSRDGGATWTKQGVTLTDELGEQRALDSHLFGVAAVGPDEAWAVGDSGVILHSTDGETWARVPVSQEVLADDNLPERIWNAVRFTDPQHGYIAGEFATTLRTSDGGATWVGRREIRGAADDLYLYALSASSTERALASGLAGRVLVSEDGGSVWESRSIDTTAGLFGAAFRDGLGVVVGDRGVLFATTDAGRAWASPRRPKLFNWLAGAALGGDSVVLVVGENGLVLRSEDGGASFTRVAGLEPPPATGVSVPDAPGSKLKSLPKNGPED
jgi:photosystem II stability/assembly factor-like uncharacterized protein